MPKSVPNNQTRALALAMAGATVSAVATMFIPVSILGSITGSTGMSELIPAAAAPLGETARALIAFAAGALTLAILAFALSRHDSGSPAATSLAPLSQWTDDDEAPSFMDRFTRIKLPRAAMFKMPWSKNDGDITELADLPKLRNGDCHPDAPPRRPLVASQDLPTLDIANHQATLIEPDAEVQMSSDVEEVVPVESAVQSAIVPPVVASTIEIEPTLAEMVAQLEAAVAERQKQLVELEAVATELSESRSIIRRGLTDTQEQPEIQKIAKSDIFIDEARQYRPSFDAVPSTAVNDDDMDSALTAALATLHRMNATGR